MTSARVASRLVDDNWISIFSFLPSTATKLIASRVCKNWREIILHPSFWKAVEVSIGHEDKHFPNVYNKSIKFIQTYCTSVVDICIKIIDFTSGLPKNWLDPIFQIKTLQRFSLLICDPNAYYEGAKYKSTKAPNCPDLRLLNLSCLRISENTLINMLNHLPNLEELYLNDFNNFSREVLPALSKCKKLQRLAAPHKIPEKIIVRTCPSLQYYIFHADSEDEDSEDSDYWGQYGTEDLYRIGNTTVVSYEVLRLNNNNLEIQKLRQLKPLVMPYTSGSIIESVFTKLALRDIDDAPIQKGVLQFLMNEMHFDVNAPAPEYIYRHSFTESNHSYRYGMSDKRDNRALEKYPLEAVITKRNFVTFRLVRLDAINNESPEAKAVLYWIQIGAKPECPEPHRSYLTIAYRADIRLLLLQHGADPNKIVDVKENIPAFAYMFMDPNFEDSAEVVYFLKDKVDFGIEIKGKTPLGWAMETGKWKSFEALTSGGAKLSSLDQLTLFHHDTPRFLQRVVSGEIDVMSLSVELVLHLINTGNGAVIAPYINANINKLDENGYTLYHYMSMTSSASNMDNKIVYKSEEGNEYRWILKDPSSCSWRDPKQIKADLETQEDLERYKETDYAKQVKKSQKNSQKQKKFVPLFTKGKNPPVPQPKIPVPATGAVAFVKPNITILTKDEETGLLLVCKSKLTAEAMTKRIQHNLAAKPEINRGDKNGWTPLHALCYGQYWQAALLLVNQGANINAQDSHGVTPMMAAIYGYKHLPESQPYSANILTDNFMSLIKNAKMPIDVNLTEKFSARTLLHLAVCVADRRLTLELIKLHCSVNARDADGFTALHVAALVGAQADVIETLVKNGADVNAQTNSLKLTPAMVYMQILGAFKGTTFTDEVSPNVIYFNHLDVCSNMMRGNKYHREITVDKQRVALLTEAPWHYHKTTFAKEENCSNEKFYQCDTVFELLTFGANLTLTDVNGNNYLHFIITMCGDNHSAVAKVAQNEPLNRLWNNKNYFKTSPFFLLCQRLTEDKSPRLSSFFKKDPKTFPNDSFIYDLVKTYNINVMECDDFGMFPFYYIMTAKWTTFDLQKWTSLPGVDLSFEFMNEYKKTNLFDILWQKGRITSQMLQDSIAKNPDFLLRQDPSGATFLMQIVSFITSGAYHMVEFLKILLQYKNHLNMQDANGNTALHIACQFFNLGAIDTIRFNLQNLQFSHSLFVTPFMLIEAGADPTIKNNRGETPLSYVPALMHHYEHLYKWVVRAAEEAVKVVDQIEDNKKLPDTETMDVDAVDDDDSVDDDEDDDSSIEYSDDS